MRAVEGCCLSILRPEFDALRKPSPYRRVRLTLSALSQSKLVQQPGATRLASCEDLIPDACAERGTRLILETRQVADAINDPISEPHDDAVGGVEADSSGDGGCQDVGGCHTSGFLSVGVMVGLFNSAPMRAVSFSHGFDAAIIHSR